MLQGSIPSKTPSKRIQRNNPGDQIIGDINVGVETRSKRQESITNQEQVSLISYLNLRMLKKKLMMNIG